VFALLAALARLLGLLAGLVILSALLATLARVLRLLAGLVILSALLLAALVLLSTLVWVVHCNASFGLVLNQYQRRANDKRSTRMFQLLRRRSMSSQVPSMAAAPATMVLCFHFINSHRKAQDARFDSACGRCAGTARSKSGRELRSVRL
jgi:hypothetical protein